jgi:translation initiation factor IF-3
LQAEAIAISTEKRVRVNRQIRIGRSDIGSDGGQLGIMAVEERSLARNQKVWTWLKSRPRAAGRRIMDYSKYKYEEARKARQARKQHRSR